MTEIEFWQIIEQSRSGFRSNRFNGNMADQERLAGLLLKNFDSESIGEFAAWFDRMTSESFSYDLWAGASIVSGGCGDDSFFYFRCWMISMGEKPYRNLQIDADNLGDYANLPGVEDIFFEEIFGVAHDVYRKKTHNDDGIPSRFFDGGGHRDPSGNRWSFDDLISLRKRFPKTWNCRCRLTWPDD